MNPGARQGTLHAGIDRLHPALSPPSAMLLVVQKQGLLYIRRQRKPVRPSLHVPGPRRRQNHDRVHSLSEADRLRPRTSRGGGVRAVRVVSTRPVQVWTAASQRLHVQYDVTLVSRQRSAGGRSSEKLI